MISVHDINIMARDVFVDAFGDVAEHSPWVAQEAWRKRPFADRDHLIGAFEAALRGASREAKLALIRAHPDLATRAKLTTDSFGEQARAGLDRLTSAEFKRFTELNEAYKARFGFPFILAVRGASKEQILAAFESRINNDADREFETALTQITRIFRLRLEDRLSP
jgi:2-oxo-4-hydroxy-4-carboxy-5-ureidoimidazoline decarboxylase